MGRGAAGVDPRGGTIVGRGTELWETPPVEYPGHFLVKRVTNAGTIRLKKRLPFLANALKQHPVGLEEVEDGIWSIHFCHVLLGGSTSEITSSEPNANVSPMLPVYSVTYLPGCSSCQKSVSLRNHQVRPTLRRQAPRLQW